MTRVCKLCREEKRLDDFRQIDHRKGSGYYHSHTCRDCHNAREWRRKQAKMLSDPEYKKRLMAQSAEHKRRWYAKPDKRAIHSRRVSQRCWVVNYCARIPRPWPAATILYVAPICSQVGPTRRADRPWTHNRLIVREERPGMVPPAGGIPAARVTTTRVDWQDDPIVVVTPAPTCPDGWRWVSAYVDRWVRKQ